MALSAVVAQLLVYPVKSCAGISLQTAELDETGLAWDRAWMVVDAEGEFVSQRSLPRMALVRPQLEPNELVLRAPGMLALHLALDAAESPCTVRVWKDTVPAWSMGPLAAQWFSDFLGQPLRLVRFDPEHRRLSSLQWTGGIEAPNLFSDGYPLLVASQASLDGLNQRLQRAGHAPVGIERFRPNLVLAGTEAHDEDRVDTMHVDTGDGVGVALQPVKPCVRCPIPNIDPATAHSDPAVGDALQSYRADPRMQGGITFGMNAIVRAGAGQVLRVGQAVRADWRFD
ncbi:MOSC domain-containing protein [Xylophilus sp. ASV27]|uniref:MOSC domain-containing protein n=1 Tax=Xylophilus sp. ASV27 TaxID=2795129 RepID=UPI0018EB7CDC|nr:MOSC N-terminal beta barrel domain-containing protein [Xylophilus sp. ASV27]